MTNKLVFSVPDTPTALQVVDFLKTRGLDESQVSVLGNESTELSAMPDPVNMKMMLSASKRGVLWEVQQAAGRTGCSAGSTGSGDWWCSACAGNSRRCQLRCSGLITDWFVRNTQPDP